MFLQRNFLSFDLLLISFMEAKFSGREQRHRVENIAVNKKWSSLSTKQL